MTYMETVPDRVAVTSGATRRTSPAPRHGKVADRSDALHAARNREVTSLWRLGAQDSSAG